jgi:hypothetical protein
LREKSRILAAPTRGGLIFHYQSQRGGMLRGSSELLRVRSKVLVSKLEPRTEVSRFQKEGNLLEFSASYDATSGITNDCRCSICII